MTPLERAARAICATFGYDPDKDDEVGLGEPGDVNWNMFEDHARAVLQAIREPSDAMKKAGAFCQPFMTAPGERPYTPGQIVAHTCYETMIDAALTEA